jgi:hypothetical protein
MVGDNVPFRHEFAHDIGTSIDVLPDQKKRGFNAVSRQNLG